MKTGKSLVAEFEVGHGDAVVPILALVGPLLGAGQFLFYLTFPRLVYRRGIERTFLYLHSAMTILIEQ